MTDLLTVAAPTDLGEVRADGPLGLGIVAAVTSALRAETGEVLARYRELRRAQGADPATDGPTELLLSIDRCRGTARWSTALGTSRDVADTVRLATLRLAAAGVTGPRELSRAAGDEARRERVTAAWSSVPGLGERSWTDLLAFVGVSSGHP